MSNEDDEQQKSRKEDSDGDNGTPDEKLLEVEGAVSSMSKSAAEKDFECKVCGKIFHRYRSWHRHKVVHSDIKPYKCEICGESFSYWTSAKRHRIIHHTNVSCEVCGQELSSRVELRSHIEGHGDDWPIKCEICGKSFTEKDLLQRHNKIHNKQTFKCEKCNKIFFSEEMFDSHKLTQCEEIFKCNKCEKSFSRKKYLKVHEKRHKGGNVDKKGQNDDKIEEKRHTEEKIFNCEECQRSFSRKQYLNLHEKMHQFKEKIFNCNKCEKSFSQLKYLKVHEKRHKGDNVDKKGQNDDKIEEKRKNDDKIREERRTEGQVESQDKPTQTLYEFITGMRKKLDDNHNLRNSMSLYCEVCRKAFSSTADLEKHQKTHQIKKLHKCEECEKTFVTGFRLKKHSRVHKGQDMYECDVCSTKFQCKSTLSRHKLDHDKETGVKCNFCDKYLVWKSNLSRHMKIFHPDKSFQENLEKTKSPKLEITVFNCDVCMRSFNTERHLKRHSLTHSGETPFQCTICQSEFKFQSSLTKHLVFSHSHSGLDGSRQCSFCNKEFAKEKSLKQHMRLHMEIKLTEEATPATEDPNPNSSPQSHSPVNDEKMSDNIVSENNDILMEMDNNAHIHKNDSQNCDGKRGTESDTDSSDADLPKHESQIYGPKRETDEDSSDSGDRKRDTSRDSLDAHTPKQDSQIFGPKRDTDGDTSDSDDRRRDTYNDSLDADIPKHDSQIYDLKRDTDDEKIDVDSDSSDSCEEHDFVRHVQSSEQSTLSGVRVYFEDGVYCQVSRNELSNLTINQLNSSPRIDLSSLEPVLQGREDVLVAVNIVFKDPETGEVLAERNQNI